MHFFTLDTPFHRLGVRVVGGEVHGISMIEEEACVPPSTRAERAVAREIEAYCRDPQHAFHLAVRLLGTPFQCRVWEALRQIPAGEVRTYGALAAALGTSARAVGNACRRNPLLLVVPCHRVVAASGLGGFSGARLGRWLDVKRALLAHEKTAEALTARRPLGQHVPTQKSSQPSYAGINSVATQ